MWRRLVLSDRQQVGRRARHLVAGEASSCLSNSKRSATEVRLKAGHQFRDSHSERARKYFEIANADFFAPIL